jgi:hypothetical protein
MAWNFLRKDEPVTQPVVPPNNEPPKPPEKSPAELIADALKPITDSVAALNAKVDSFKPAPPPAKTTELTSVLDNEDAAFSQRLTPIILQNLEIEARLNLANVKQEYTTEGFGDLWKECEPEIVRELNASELTAPDGKGGIARKRGNPEYIRNVVDMVLGRAARKKGLRFDGAKSTFFIEGAGSGSESTESRNADTEGLTPAQIRAARNMKITPAEYKKALGSLEIVQ